MKFVEDCWLQYPLRKDNKTVKELQKVTSKYSHTLVFFIRIGIIKVRLLVVNITKEFAEFTMAFQSIFLFPSLKLSFWYPPKTMSFFLQVFYFFHLSGTWWMKHIVKSLDLHCIVWACLWDFINVFVLDPSAELHLSLWRLLNLLFRFYLLHHLWIYPLIITRNIHLPSLLDLGFASRVIRLWALYLEKEFWTSMFVSAYHSLVLVPPR